MKKSKKNEIVTVSKKRLNAFAIGLQIFTAIEAASVTTMCLNSFMNGAIADKFHQKVESIREKRALHKVAFSDTHKVPDELLGNKVATVSMGDLTKDELEKARKKAQGIIRDTYAETTTAETAGGSLFGAFKEESEEDESVRRFAEKVEQDLRELEKAGTHPKLRFLTPENLEEFYKLSDKMTPVDYSQFLEDSAAMPQDDLIKHWKEKLSHR